MALTEDAKDLMKLKDWPTLVDNAIKDMELDDFASEDPELRTRVVGGCLSEEFQLEVAKGAIMEDGDKRRSTSSYDHYCAGP